MLISIRSHRRQSTGDVLLLFKNIYHTIGRLDDIFNIVLPRVSNVSYTCIFVGSLYRIENAYDTFQRNKKTFIDIIYLTNYCGLQFYNITINIFKF